MQVTRKDQDNKGFKTLARPYADMDNSMFNIFRKSIEALELHKALMGPEDFTDGKYDGMINSVKKYMKCYSRSDVATQGDYLNDISHFNRAQISRGPQCDDWIMDGGSECTLDHKLEGVEYRFSFPEIYSEINSLLTCGDDVIQQKAFLLKISFIHSLHIAMACALRNEVVKDENEDSAEDRELYANSMEEFAKEVLDWIPNKQKRSGGIAQNVGNFMDTMKTNMPQLMTMFKTGVREMGIEKDNPEAVKKLEEMMKMIQENSGDGGQLDKLTKDLQSGNLGMKDIFEKVKDIAGPLAASFAENGEAGEPTEGDVEPNLNAEDNDNEVLCIEK